MSSTVNGLRLRQVLGRDQWLPPEPFGPDGWMMLSREGDASVIVSAWTDDNGTRWIHASRTGPGRLPTYDELMDLHRAVWPTGYSYQVQAPADRHVNIHPHALHLWGRADGAPVLPEFARDLGGVLSI